MGSIARRIGLVALRGNIRQYSTKSQTPWLIENKPGPYPKTEDEKIAAAKKYGLLREEYEPFPDDGCGFGDYPKTLVEPIGDRNVFYPWTDNLARRNFGDPIHPEDGFYSWFRITNNRERVAIWKRCFFMILPLVTFAVLIYHPAFGFISYHHPTLAKQFPYQGVEHYTFETVD